MRSVFVVAAAALLALALASPGAAETFAEPKSKVAFDTESGDLVLLGTGLRVKKIIFSFKAYAVGLYVDKGALEGPLAPFEGKPVSDELFGTLQNEDFKKELVLHFLRDLGEKKIRGAMRDALEKDTDPEVLAQFISYFPEVKKGQRCSFTWVPGGTIETVMAGEERPPIEDPAFAKTLFGLYVGPKPLQKDFKKGMAVRLQELLAE
jgi:hypothetical protein